MWKQTVIAIALVTVCACAIPAAADPQTAPFAPLVGRWVGEGRLGVRDGTPENVKCRVTYVAGPTVDEIKQNIRCASAGGKIEVLSAISHAAGMIRGSWTEAIHDTAGDLSGEVTPNGFRVKIAGSDISANMELVLRGDKQIVEIQFHNTSLIGLTLLLTRG